MCYFLALCIFGGEFDQRLKVSAPISDLARPKNNLFLWEPQSESLGYSYWLVFINFFLHAINAGIVGFYIYKRYKPRQKNREIGVDSNDKARGTAMIF